jgi:CMP-N,N'-diacetyllegionaminic acid synthase
MIAGKRILAVVPARGGSKGIALKNLRPVLGRPMVAHAGDVCRALDWLDRAVVSTDHPEISRVAEASGLAAPFIRPPDLSGDRVGDWDVLHHALTACEAIDGVRYDIVLMLQPTSPLRRPEHVTATVEALLDGSWDAAWTVSETDSKGHPLKQLTIDGGQMALYDPAGAAIIARQQLAPVYHRNGIAYAFTRECLTEQRTTLGARTRAVVLDGHFVSIDTEHDIRLIEFLSGESARHTA